MEQDGVWLNIVEYANVKKTSISTIRRAIKANHVKFKEINGRYLIWTKSEINNKETSKRELSLELENNFLKKQIRELQEEVSDLKMLLAVYENNQTQLPPLPEIEL